MDGVVGAISSALAGGRFKNVHSALQVDGWFIVPGHFRFGYPWPWRPSPDPASLVDDTGGESAADVFGALYAPRTTGQAALAVWRGTDSFRPVVQAAESRFAALYGGTGRGTRRVRAGGAPALVIDIDVPGGDSVWRVLVSDNDQQVVHIEVRVPQPAAAGYRPHLDTMIASWLWQQ